MSGRQQRARRQRTAHQQQTMRETQRAAGVTQPPLLMAASRQDERFIAFHRAHPEVYRAFKRLALSLYARGHHHWGAAAIFEVLRYESAISGKPDDAWKLNNDFRSRYSRLFMAEYAAHPVLSQFFETRQLRSA